MTGADSRPNILFYFVDQQRWDTCGCYGQPQPITPNLDRMAADGVRFKHAYSCQPVCGPARASLQTGRFATEVNCPTNHCMLPLDAPTIAKQLGQHGYQTAYIGKWHLASCGERGGPDDFRTKPVPTERRAGYDYWLASDVLEFTSHAYDGYMFDGDGNQREFPEGRFRADAQTDWVIEYLREKRDQDKPFFLMTSYIEPHHQNDHKCYEGPLGSKQTFSNFVQPGDLKKGEGDWEKEYPDYLGCIHSLDANLGRVRAALEELGIADNTLIIYTSDHGSHFCTRNGEYKRSCHDGCIRIPMVLCGPDFTGGKTSDQIASLIDVPATILEAAGAPPLAHQKGRSLVHALEPSADWPQEAFLQISESQSGRAIRTHRWTYSVRAPQADQKDIGCERYREDFLYDNEADPHQQNNLVANPDFEDVRHDLRQRLLAWLAVAEEPIPLIEPAAN